jgi:HSP20 family protein
MAQRPPRSIPPGISLSRRLSERARAAAPQPTPTPTGAPEGGLGAIVEALQGALHGLIDKVSEAARSAGEAAPGKTERDDAAPGGNVRSGVHTIELGGKGARMVFGYTLRMGLDGVSAEPFGDVPDFGNVPDEAAAPAAAASAGARQPIVELFEEADAIVVVAELPGADPASLVCRIDGQTLLIEAAGTRRYRKQVALPAAVRPAEISRNFQNGILEVRLARAQPA